jgi:hypothetical protein
MKLEFVEKVKKLSNEGLTKMVTKIQEILATSISDLDSDRIQIKVDDFDRENFNKINEFVEELILQDVPSKRQKT